MGREWMMEDSGWMIAPEFVAILNHLSSILDLIYLMLRMMAAAMFGIAENQ